MDRFEALPGNSNNANFAKALHGLDRVLQFFALFKDLYQTSFGYLKSIAFGSAVRRTVDFFSTTRPQEVQFL